jgi:hypothetical protein
MYEEYLGEGYHDRIRKMLTVDETLLPDRIIDADLNIGAMKQLIAPAIEKMQMFGKYVDTEEKYKLLSNAALYYLCGILCMAMKSRTSSPPFNIPKYKKRWDKKRDGYMEKGNMIMKSLLDSAMEELKKDAIKKIFPVAAKCGVTDDEVKQLVNDLADEMVMPMG